SVPKRPIYFLRLWLGPLQKGCYVTPPLAVEQALALKPVLDLFPVAPGKAVNVDPSAVAIADLQRGCVVGMSGTAAEAITPLPLPAESRSDGSCVHLPKFCTPRAFPVPTAAAPSC